ncbi:ABC transporter ATP-binding protein [Sphingomonas changnyeongensis]|uniref:ABC transporter ATP-binding protein n=1 Tax=Sphingomonas changnyeongensis TaxID=2698679 RepID=A0A7Z2NX43_9SPHN|nr:ABC transporter ATP-binding protein [Sphingomonas changnyeongensis]QHL91400.1 ABC transporter ATP-binding protein [Sphingomonas changnyeongensis]
MAAPTTVRLSDVIRWARPILGPDNPYFSLVIIYGIGVGLLSLAIPISVQLLVNSIANLALPVPLFTLALVLLTLLLISALLGALAKYIMELFRRRFMARMVADITLRAVHAQNPYFADERRDDLFNRYFDIVTMQKSMPSLLIGGFTIVLQSTVGFIVTAFYHPFFLAFNLLFILVLWVIWQLWARGAMTSVVELSHKKYALAHWLESLGGSNGFYKSSRHLDYAMDQTEARTAAYVDAHRRHFHYAFPQTVALLVLYAVASAGLLALGGWLVIQNQLSIGQLVAAELIMSGIFYGAASLGPYLDTFYDMVAGLEELSLFRDIPQERIPDRFTQERPPSGALAFRGVRVDLGNTEARLDLEITPSSRLVAAAAPGMERQFSSLLKHHFAPIGGMITVGGADINDFDVYQLRSEVIVLNRPTIVESTIRDYLGLSRAPRDPVRTLELLKLVGLDQRIAEMPQGMDTLLSSTGWPLSIEETMQLKLAGALLSEPRILVLSGLYDMMPVERLAQVFDHLRDKPVTLIYFSNRPEHVALDGFLWLGRNAQTITTDRATFDALRAGAMEDR